jgi:putative colanic acid biosynthesis acetyltransferase WcaF
MDGGAFGGGYSARKCKGVLIRPSVKVTYPWKVKIGAYCMIGDLAELYSLGPIEIGADAVISQQSYLCAGTHDHTKLDFRLTANPIHIEDQAWLAMGCFVAPA